MPKILFTSHLANFVKFNKPYMEWFQKQEWEVHYASLNEEAIPFCDKAFKVDFNRSPFACENLKAIKQLKKIIQKENYDIIHCHTPMGGVVTRIAAQKARKKGTKVLYTAHGFHFYKGAPKINWILFYPVEKWLSQFTDYLMTINKEDFILAKKKLKAKKNYHIDGVGVNLNKFKPVDKEEKLKLREQYGYLPDDKILISVAEFTKNKNQIFSIKTLSDLIKNDQSIKFLFVGAGDQLDYCEKISRKLNLANQIHFLGYCHDVQELLQISDILISSSYREGLPVNIIEGMAVGLPVVCTRIRGHVDVIEDNLNGYLYTINDVREFTTKVQELLNNKNLRSKGYDNNVTIRKYSLENAVKNMSKIYMQIIGDKTK